MTDKYITVASVNEVIDKAKVLFADGVDFVVASGSATASGMAFEMEHGTLLMHRSGKAVSVEAYSGLEAAKAAILA